MSNRNCFFNLFILCLASSMLLSCEKKESRPPNIIVILADDMGYSDIGCYGSEIETPALDQLATGGLRFTQFYNAARCCPTRASLLTGLFPHQTGMGGMTYDRGLSSYQGDLNRQCVTLAEVLKESGYSTYMSGKWHLTKHFDEWKYWLKDEEKQYTSKNNWPRQRGFDEFFGTIYGAGSYYDPSTLTRNNQPLEPGKDFYYTDAISDTAISFISNHLNDNGRRPFFCYIAYTAPHWPLHALSEDIIKYNGEYDIGWDKIREERYKRMLKMGIINPEWSLSDRSSGILSWEDCENKEWWAASMEVYAAMVDRMDQGIGKIVEVLKKNKQLKNTLILFLADNGGCAECLRNNAPLSLHFPDKQRDGSPITRGKDFSVFPGPESTYMSYCKEWANASNTPFRYYKHYIHEGGISTPLIAHWSSGISSKNGITDQVGHIIDIMATCIDVAGAEYPEEYRGEKITPLEGQSLLPAFRNERYPRKPIGWEHHGNRGYRDGKWKLVTTSKGTWELYDMEADRTELNNLINEEPEKAQQMLQGYKSWADHCGVVWPIN